MSVEKRLHKINERILQACRKAQRPVGSVKLVAVSKKQSLHQIREVFEAGQRAFGENYVQELLPKKEQFENLPIEWHFIGPLQSNKARKVIGKVELIHSVDRLSLLQEISRQAVVKELHQKILLQVNLSDEETKSGASEKGFYELLEDALELPGIEICGLMTMPPLAPNQEDNRAYFHSLKKLFDDIQKGPFGARLPFFRELSMGTSQDFEVAVEEGATLIRVGTEIFGSRKD